MNNINEFDNERKWQRFDEFEAAAKRERLVTNLFLQKRINRYGTHLSHEAYRLYGALLDFRNSGTGRCYPAREKLIKRSALSERHYRKALAELVYFGWVQVTRHMNKTNDYTVCYVARRYSDGTMNEDQTCPTKDEAAAYKRSLSQRRKLQQRYVDGESKFVPTWMKEPADGYGIPLSSDDPDEWPDEVAEEIPW